MKKILYIATLLSLVFFTSCDKIKPRDPGATATEALAGQWYVRVDGAYNDGSEDYEDIFSMGRVLILTYNTAANKPEEMYINDLGNIWEFTCKIACDQDKLTFSADKSQNEVEDYEDLEVTITDGKVVPGGAVTPSGSKADYIEFYVVFSDDTYIPKYYDKLKVSGWRYTGLVNDD